MSILLYGHSLLNRDGSINDAAIDARVAATLDHAKRTRLYFDHTNVASEVAFRKQVRADAVSEAERAQAELREELESRAWRAAQAFTLGAIDALAGDAPEVAIKLTGKTTFDREMEWYGAQNMALRAHRRAYIASVTSRFERAA